MREWSSFTICHVSHVTCHVSHVTCFFFVFFFNYYFFYTFLIKTRIIKWLSLSVEVLLSTGPTPSSLLSITSKLQHFVLCKTTAKNPVYGRHQLSRPMQIVEPIQIWRGCVIYLWSCDLRTNERRLCSPGSITWKGDNI